jgi:GR25 family glycosyltransferase involved in LPS biosynthesis
MFKTLLINLENRPDRLIHTLKELRKVGLSKEVIRIEAINSNIAEELKCDYISEKAFNNINDITNTCILPNHSSLGCAISHINCWKYMINNNVDECIIVEDDIEIVNSQLFTIDINNIKNIKNKIAYDNPSIFIVFNSHKLDSNITNYNSYSQYDYKFNSSNLNIIRFPIKGIFFYYINLNMAKYFLKYIQQITYQIDIEIGLLSQNANEKTKFFNYNTYNLIQSNKFKTDIQTYLITSKDIGHILNIPDCIADIIFEYIPNIFKYNIQNFIN